MENIKKNIFISSLKFKFISSFAIITLVLSSLCVFTYFTMNSTVNKLDSMVQTTILANGVTSAIEDDSVLTNYILHKNDADKNKIKESFNLIDNNFSSIKKGMAADDENGINALESLGNLIKNYEENGEQVIKLIDDGSALSKAIEAKDKTVKAKGYVKAAVDKFIGIELSEQKIIKYELNKKAKLMGLILLLAILGCSVLSILGAVIFSNRISGMISKLAKYAHSIANGNLNVERLEVKSKDDISILANSFNKMGENLRNIIGEI
ncbi:MAG: HAMP domain-containing protein, partial [Ruminiclostridium sp.]